MEKPRELVHRILDRCTTLTAECLGGGCITHNDGDTYLKDKSTIVDMRPEAIGDRSDGRVFSVAITGSSRP